MKTIILYGLRRSGNHFIISTILQQFTNYVHINDVKSLSYDKYIKYSKIKKDKERIDNYWTGFKNVECVVISLENQIMNSDELIKFQSLDDCHFMILLRSPYNHFASVWQVYNKDKMKLLEIINLWKIYATSFIDKNVQCIKVFYDKYCVDDSYMIEILKKMHIDNIKIDCAKTIKWQKSSFKNEEHKKQVYGTLDNCIFKNDEIFISMINDNEIDDMYNMINEYLNLYF